MNPLRIFGVGQVPKRLENPGRFWEKEIRDMGVLFGKYVLGLRAQLLLMVGVMRMSVTKFFIADPTTVLLVITVALFWGGIFFLEN